MSEDNIPTNPEESSEETPKESFNPYNYIDKEEELNQDFNPYNYIEDNYDDVDFSKLMDYSDRPKRGFVGAVIDNLERMEEKLPIIGPMITGKKIKNVYDIAQDFMTNEELVSEEELTLLKDWIEENNIDYNTWGDIVNVVFDMPGLMGEFIVGGLTTKAFLSAGKGAVKKYSKKELLKKIMSDEFKNKVNNVVSKKIRKKLVSDNMKRLGLGASGATIAMYNPVGLAEVKTYEKMLPSLRINADDDIIITSYGMNKEKAMKQAKLEVFAELFSEALGKPIAEGLGGVTKFAVSKSPSVQKGLETFKKIVLSQTDEVNKNNVLLVALHRQIKKLNPNATQQDIRKMINALGHDGILGEILEERVVDVSLSVAKKLNDLGVVKDFDNPNYEFKLPTSQEFLVELGAFSVLPIGGKVISSTYETATVDKSWWDSDIRKQINEEREKGNFDSEVIDVAERLAKNDPKAFEDKTAINFIDEVREVSREQLRQEGKSEEEIDAFFKGEGLDPIKVGEETVSVLGSTLEDNGKVIINLYKGAKADTVVEEFFGSAKRRLSEENLTVWNNYFNEYVINGGTLTSQELFEKEGKKYYFEQGLYADKPIQVVFRKIKQAFDTIFNIQRDKLPDDVRNMYEEAGLGTIGTGTVKGEAVDESFQLSPQKLSKLDATLRELTEEGKSAKMWYEESGQAILDLVDGDVEKARQLLSIIAITSPQMDVKTNLGQMIKAYYKYVQGANPEAGRFPKGMAEKIKDVMDGKEFEGIKTSSFYRNLMAQVESSADRPVTVDLWMMRAFGFDKDKPTDLEYKQIEKAVQDIADELGWEPHQVQASMWTSTKARWETIFKEEMERSVNSGAYKNKKWRSKTAESNFRKRMFKRLKETPLSEQKIEDEAFSYADALSYYKGVISTETFPHPSTETFENIDNLSYEQMVEYDQEIRKILVDENGKDKIAKLIGLFQAGNFNAPGFYEGDVAPANHLEVLMSTADVSINQEAKDLLELYASIYGILTKQQAVGVTKVFKAKSKKQANVAMVNVKGNIPFEQIYSEMLDRGYDTGAIPQGFGFNVVNFTNENNKEFQKVVEEVVNKVFENTNETIIIKLGQSDGLYIENNWKENPNGESYKQGISESKRQDDITEFISSTSNEISKVNDKYREKWSKEEVTPQDTKESFQLKDIDSDNTSEIKIPDTTWKQWFSLRLIDNLSRLKLIERKYGFKDDDWSPSKALENFVGIGTEAIDKIKRDIVDGKKSFLKRLRDAKIKVDSKHKSSKLSVIEMIGEYLYAKHSLERNDYFRKKNKDKIKEIKAKLKTTNKETATYDKLKKQLDRLQYASGMTDKVAKELLEVYRGSGIHKFALEFYRTITKPSLKMRLDVGIITKEEYDEYTKRWKFYVPLKGLLDSEVEYNYTTGKGFSVTSKGILGAKGRTTLANNPFLQSITDYESSVILSEKNKALIEVYNFFNENKNEKWSVSGRKHKPIVDESGDIALAPTELKDNQIQVFVDGKKKVITINDADLMSAFTKTKIYAIQQYFGGITNVWRKLQTQWSPKFILANFERDLQASMINMSMDTKYSSWKTRMSVIKDIFPAMVGIVKSQREGTGEWVDIYQEYKENGGKTGWFEFQTLEEKEKDFIKRIEGLEKEGNFKKIFSSFGDFITDINEAVEMAVRLSTYKQLRDLGISKRKSAHYGKDLTVNFNRRGQWTGISNLLYVFSNADIQGKFRLFRGVVKDGKVNQKALQVIGVLMFTGFVSSLINRLRDEEEWDNVEDHIKDRHWVWMRENGNHIKIPMAFQYNIPIAIGGMIEQMAFGELDEAEASMKIFKMFTDVLNPLGSSGSMLQTISPTLSDPFVQLYENKNWLGKDIKPEEADTFSPKKKPESQLYWGNDETLSKKTTAWLNEITGGSTTERGLIDVSPEYVDHMFDAIVGGTGRFIKKSLSSSKAILSDAPMELSDIPILGGHFGEATRRKIKKEFNELYKNSGRNFYGKETNKKFRSMYKELLKDNKKNNEITPKERIQRANSLTKKYNSYMSNQIRLRESRKK